MNHPIDMHSVLHFAFRIEKRMRWYKVPLRKQKCATANIETVGHVA